jgi:hypothetical protein
MPFSATDSGESPALSVMLKAAVNAPAVAGVKCPWFEQVAPVATLHPPPFVKTKEDVSTPVTPMLGITRGVSPVSVRTTDCEAPVVPIFRRAYRRLLGVFFIALLQETSQSARVLPRDI